MNNNQNETNKKVGFGLGVGIAFLPYVFSWFTLQKGYSKAARIVSFVWLGVSLTALAVSEISPDHERSAVEVVQRQEPAEIALPVTARQLYRDYQANEPRADAKYKGKLLKVTGRVNSIDKGPFGGIYLLLDTGEYFAWARIKLNKESESWAATLNKGDLVEVTCRGAMMILGSPSCEEE